MPLYRGPKGRRQLVLKHGRPIIAMVDANKQSPAWMKKVKRAAENRCMDLEPINGPVRFSARFFFARPQNHYGKNGVLRSAPDHHSQTPDLGKLIRAVEDAMTGVVYVDDRMISEYGPCKKEWTDPGRERVEITVEPIL